MSKERLEEIQKEVNYAYRRDGSISTKAVTMPIEHYEHLYEQAERVQELEEYKNSYEGVANALDNMTEKLLELENQNKRYRDLLESLRYTQDIAKEIRKENPNIKVITPDDLLQHMLRKINEELEESE